LFHIFLSFIVFFTYFRTLKKFLEFLNQKKDFGNLKVCEQLWATFQSKAAWRWPGPTALLAWSAQASGRSVGATTRGLRMVA
jgi:hypothetical protein